MHEDFLRHARGVLHHFPVKFTILIIDYFPVYLVTSLNNYLQIFIQTINGSGDK